MGFLYTYEGDKPFTNDTLTEVINDPHDGFFRDKFSATENWAANVNDRSGNGWGFDIYTTTTQTYLGGFAGDKSREKGQAYDSPTAYISPITKAAVKRDSVYEYEYRLILGTLSDSEIRSYVYQAEAKAQN